MESCTICKKDFKDKRGLYGHYRFVHGIEYRSRKPAKKITPTGTEVTKKKIEEIKKRQELTEVIKEKEFQAHSLDKQINEAKEEIKRLNEEVKRLSEDVKDNSSIAMLNETKEEIKQLNEGIKQLNKDVRDKSLVAGRDKPTVARTDSVTHAVPSGSQKEGEKSTQPILKRETRGKPLETTARSNKKKRGGMFREIFDETVGVGVRDIRGTIRSIRPRNFFKK